MQEKEYKMALWCILKILSQGKRGSLVISALALSARGHGFDPHGRRGKILVSEHAFLSVICRDDNNCAVLRIGTLTGGPLCRESHPLCRLKNPIVVYMITYRLSSCKNRCVQYTPAHNPRERV